MYKFDLRKDSFNFSIEIIKIYNFLVKNKKEYVLSKQLLRSGTSIGANIYEAFDGQSKKDFLSKISISLKEAQETRYWLKLLIATEYLEKIENIEKNLNDIICVLVKSIKTIKKQLNID